MVFSHLPHGFMCGITGVLYGMLGHLSLIYSQQCRKQHLCQHGNHTSWLKWEWAPLRAGWMDLALLPLCRSSLASHPLLLKLCHDSAHKDSGDSEILQPLQTLACACCFWGLVQAVVFLFSFFLFLVMNLFLSIRVTGITQNAKFPCKNVSCNKRNLEPAWQPGSCYRMKPEPRLVSTWHQTSS